VEFALLLELLGRAGRGDPSRFSSIATSKLLLFLFSLLLDLLTGIFLVLGF
jgi:hypothetical protein